MVLMVDMVVMVVMLVLVVVIVDRDGSVSCTEQVTTASIETHQTATLFQPECGGKV